VALDFPEIAKQGVLLRKYGQEVIRHVSGKRVHGTGAIPGGVNKALSVAERDEMARDIDQMMAWTQGAIDLVRRLHETNPDFYNVFGESAGNMMGLMRPDGALDFYHGALRAVDPDGRTIFDQVDYADYQQVLQEEIKPWSYMKFPHIRSLGADRGWYKVGPLARVQAATYLATPLAEIERQKMMALGNGKPVHGTLFYHWARLVEILHALEMIRDLLNDPDILGTDLMADRGERRHEAVGVIEAPRGTLFHHYRVNDDDQVTYCNLIVSTTNNNQAMNEAIRTVARQYLDGHEVTEGLLNHIEVAIRAYDPCLSCATHALGKMPLIVEAVDADGRIVSTLSKS
jgi:NAD-reducing hydrogenase large subunit